MAKKIWTPQFLSPHQRFMLKRLWREDPLFRVGVFITIAFIVGFFIGRATVQPETIIIEPEPEPVIIPEPEPEPVIIEKEVSRLWKMTGKNAKLIGKYGNNIQWKGKDVKEMPGKIEVNLDPENDIGKITVEIIGLINPEDKTILDGNIGINFKTFDEEENYMDNGIAEDLDLFGNTDKEEKYLPTTHAFVAAWGTASLDLNKQSIYKDLKAFFMYSEGNRRDDNTITDDTGKVYAPKFSEETGFVDPDDREIHLILYEDFDDARNYPTKSAFIYLIFEDIELEESPGSEIYGPAQIRTGDLLEVNETS